ncbi:hypothetical protein UFOVP1292_13 [uncultured Caudovirales phage]|uniref:Uncharacterized protein n=1 Tax=uncultured Caudovirales phage TaxID=2100421 RepID=A0A6J5PHB5_9CAUD|nr:hypothetical protein UFOVP859_82 [uncultured Caudovirales phage]CAB4168555.1 hypothetical protein UFOVP882_81 [uncultured Caudovirales phage]CAB4196409.1 hypothetical protein UFOVP1292_13 [uncultured Caudovirales phage]CAB4204975.1 hypothetical protein UFOVP1411_4 [uncultured Caudovirales phage]
MKDLNVSDKQMELPLEPAVSECGYSFSVSNQELAIKFTLPSNKWWTDLYNLPETDKK